MGKSTVQFRHNGRPVAVFVDGGANLLTGAESLTTSDNITYVLSNLTTLTNPRGTYQLTLTTAAATPAPRLWVPGAPQ